MKKITPLEVNDIIELKSLISNRKKGYEILEDELGIIENNYAHYIDTCGNPWTYNQPEISLQLKERLKSWYTSPPSKTLTYIEEVRERHGLDTCPNCGSSNPRTVDHYLPKSSFQELAIFSKNLVPACSCNQKKGANTKGHNEGVRFAHPYFDEFLDDELYIANFEGKFEAPRITIALVDPSADYAEILDFHMKNVLIKNGVEQWWQSRWSNLLTMHHDFFAMEKGDQLQAVLEKRILMEDSSAATKNNWNSMFFRGILNNEIFLNQLKSYFSSI